MIFKISTSTAYRQKEIVESDIGLANKSITIFKDPDPIPTQKSDSKDHM